MLTEHKYSLDELKKLDLRRAPLCPFGNLTWDRYYWKRSQEAPDYEEDYWGKTIDPDGRDRNMLSDEEWQKQVKDIQWIVDMINAQSSGKLLDVGCGPGYFLSAVDRQWEKQGVDVSSVALKIAAKYADVRQGDFPKMDYRPGYFDLVFMNHVIEHVQQPLAYVKAVHQALKVGGICIIGTPDFDSGCARRFKNNYRMLHDKGHISLFTSASLVKMLEDHQFRILHVEYPYFDSIWFTEENLLRMRDILKVSPPFYGNHVVVFAEKI